MKPIDALSFGFSDASAYLAPESRALLKKFFLQDENLDELLQHQRFFLIGEKGTGKTAYAAFLSTCGFKTFVGHTAFVADTDYLTMHALAQRHGFNAHDQVANWEMIFLIAGYQRLTATPESYDILDPTIHSAAEAVLEAMSVTDTSPLSDTLELVQNSNEAINIVNESMHGKSGAKQYSIADDNRRNVKSLRQFFFKAIASVRAKQQHIIFIDGMDVRPTNAPYSEYLGIVKALVNAVWVLNTERLSALPQRDLRVVLLIRPDILEGVGLHNLSNKIRDNSVVLDWKTTYQHYRNSKLFRLADRMLASQQDQATEAPVGETWDHYFPFKVFNRIRDTDEPSDASFIPFLRYSFYRPRDIITLMSIMKTKTTSMGQGHLSEFGRDLMHDHRVRQEYSAYLLGEVKEGLSFYYKIDDYELFLKFFEFLDEFIAEKTLQFDYKSFCVAYSRLLKHAESAKLEVPIIFSSADRFLQFLYELNIIAFSGKDGRYLRWCFRERSYANIRPKVSADCVYKIHLGIARALNPARFA